MFKKISKNFNSSLDIMNERSYIDSITNKRSFIIGLRVAFMKHNIWILSCLILIMAVITACYENQDGIEDESIRFLQVITWPEGNVYFRIDDSFDPNDDDDQYTLRMINLAMIEWSSAADIRFVEVSGGDEYVYVISKSDVTSSTIGYQRYPRLFIKTLASQRAATHEVGHCLGLTHEHQRPDRDNYITVHWDNIRIEAAGQYQLLGNSLYDETDYPYDYRSVMHYSTSTGTVSAWKKTYSINDEGATDKWPTYLSEIDREKVRDLYGGK